MMSPNITMQVPPLIFLQPQKPEMSQVPAPILYLWSSNALIPVLIPFQFDPPVSPRSYLVVKWLRLR